MDWAGLGLLFYLFMAVLFVGRAGKRWSDGWYDWKDRTSYGCFLLFISSYSLRRLSTEQRFNFSLLLSLSSLHSMMRVCFFVRLSIDAFYSPGKGFNLVSLGISFGSVFVCYQQNRFQKKTGTNT